MTVESIEETDSLNVTVESNDGSLYIPTPQRKVRERIESMSIIPPNICFMDLKQLDKFIRQVNQIRCCGTPGCKGALCPIHVKSVGLGGA
jgi:DNA-directed RNA polymerase alpha subunit